MLTSKKMKSVTIDRTNVGSQNAFQKLIKWEIGGVISFPVYVILAIIIFLAAYFHQLPNNMLGGFAVIMIIGMFLGDIGHKIPILKSVGGPAILSLFVPSLLVFFEVISPAALAASETLMRTANFLYFYIAALVAGSILGMNRIVLIQGFIRMFIPLLAGTITAISAGLFVGQLFGRSVYETFFFIIVPIIAGGIGEGILPLSIGYAGILDVPNEQLVSQLVPAAVIGNICAVITAGLLKSLGEKRPELTGNGRLVKSKKDDAIFKQKEAPIKIDLKLMGAGVLLACSFFVVGGLLEKFLHIPGPILMIILATLVKYTMLLPKKLESGAQQFYKLMSSSFTYPLMVGLGMLYIPLDDVVKVIDISYVLICASVVLAMFSAGWFVGKLMKMFPIDAAIVTGCHSGLGGTGDVAILSASNRMELMPFAQISTRLGGAATVITATILLRFFS